MKRRAPPPPETYLPSTTRAVAWGALFFSLVALLVSGATFFLTWRDGRLPRNAVEFTRQIREAWASDPADDPANTAGRSPSMQDLENRLGRIESMVRHGESQAPYYVDTLVEDLERLARDSSEKLGPALEKIKTQLEGAREAITHQAPEALDRIRRIGEDVRALDLPEFGSPPSEPPSPATPEAAP